MFPVTACPCACVHIWPECMHAAHVHPSQSLPFNLHVNKLYHRTYGVPQSYQVSSQFLLNPCRPMCTCLYTPSPFGWIWTNTHIYYFGVFMSAHVHHFQSVRNGH